MDVAGIQKIILPRLAAVRRKENLASVLHGTTFSALAFLAALLTTLIIEDLLYLGVVARTVMFWMLALLAVVLFLLRVARPVGLLLRLLPSEMDDATALKVGRAFPDIRDRLVNGLQLWRERDRTTLASHELIDASVEDLLHDINGLDFTAIYNFAGSRRMAKVLAVTAATAILLFVLFPTSFFGAAHRLLNYSEAFAAPVPFRFLVEPGNREILKGESVHVRVRVEGTTLSAITLGLRPEGESTDEERELTAASDGSFGCDLVGLKSTTQYSVRSHNVESARYILTVVDRPVVRVLRVTLTPPSYSRLPVRQQDDNIGDVAALKGTRITVAVEANKELRAARLIFGDSTTTPLAVSGRKAAGSTILLSERTYCVGLEDSAGTPNADPVEYALRIVPDAFPAVSILIPGTNLDITENTSVNLMVKITDDYGFSRLRLGYKLVQSRYEQSAELFSYITLPPPQALTTEALVPYTWNIGALHLVPEDIVTYFVEVFDNDVVSGPKSTMSEFYSIRLPSLEEVFSDADAKHETSIERMVEALKQAEDVHKDLDELQRELNMSREKVDWRERTKTEELMKQYDDIRAKLEESKQTMDQLIAGLQKNQVLSKETLQKYQELQHMMEQLSSPEFAEALKKLQEAMQQLTPEAMKQALQQFNFSEEHFRQSIERTLNLLKRIHIEQKLDEARRRAEEMQKQQEELQPRTEKASASDQNGIESITRDQQGLKKKLEALERELAEIQNAMGEFPTEMPMADMERLSRELQQSGLEQQLSDIEQQLRQMQPQQASHGQQEAARSMQKISQQLRQMQEGMRQNQQRQIVNEMRKSIQDVLELSRRQEELKNETQGLEPNSQRFRDHAQAQMEVLRSLGSIAERLGTLSQKTFGITPEMGKSIGNAMRGMSQALQSLDQRNQGAAAQQQAEAMGSLNESALQLQLAMNAMTQAGGQGMGMAGLMQRLQRMATQQQGVNDGTRGMGGMTPEQAAAMARLAAEQGMVRKSLEQLAREAAASGELSKILGDLNRVAQEMREVQTDLAGGSVSPEMMQKQERILSRLLDAQRSARERDFEKERKSTAGRSILRTGPGAVDLATQEGRNRLRHDLQKALEEGYARDYEEVIRRYFEVLEQYEHSTK